MITKNAEIMSDEGYVKSQGKTCPICKDHSIETEGHPVFINNINVIQHCNCFKCGSSWDELYVLVGYQDLVAKVKK